jgi:hypothetical protein
MIIGSLPDASSDLARDPAAEQRPETVATVPGPVSIHADVKDIGPLLARIAVDTTAALGENLVSLLIYGSHPRGEGRPGSDVNLMVVVKDASSHLMSDLLVQAQAWTKEGAASPIVITTREFASSHDALALEYLDIAASRKVLAGEDLFAEFAPDWGLVRLALEQEARRKAIILMKRWLATAGNGRDARRIISDTIPGYVALLRGMVLYERRAVARLHAKTVLGELDGTRGLDPVVWRRLYAVGKEYKRATTDQLKTLIAAYIDQAQALVRYLDGLDGNSQTLS